MNDEPLDKKEIVYKSTSIVLFSTNRPNYLERQFIDSEHGSQKKCRNNYEISTFFCLLLNLAPMELDLICKNCNENSHIIQRCISNNLMSKCTFNNCVNSHNVNLLSDIGYSLHYKPSRAESINISEETALKLKLATSSELEEIQKYTTKVGIIVYCLFRQIGYNLRMFNLEFGHNCINKKLTCYTPFTLDNFYICDKNYKYVKYDDETCEKICNDLLHKQYFSKSTLH